MPILALDPRVHVVVETDAARWFRREFRDPSLLTYWHMYEETWVLATWVSRMGGLVSELKVLGPWIAEMNPAVIEELRFNRSDAAYQMMEDVRRKLRVQDKHEHDDQVARWEERRSIIDFYRRRSKHHDPDDPSWSRV